MISVQHFPKIIMALLTRWVCWYAYGYFSDKTIANIVITGINENAYHCGDIKCCIESDKNGIITLMLDRQHIA